MEQGGWGSPVPRAGLQQDPGEREGCTAPTPGLAPRSAFNNILSNLGYVLLGLLFLLIILQREINYNRALLRNDTHALVRDTAAYGGSAAWWGSASRTPHFPSFPLLCPAGVWHPQALWALLCHGHCPNDGGAAQRLLPCLPQLHQLPVW